MEIHRLRRAAATATGGQRWLHLLVLLLAAALTLTGCGGDPGTNSAPSRDRTHTSPVDGQLIAWSGYGAGAPTLVFVHGWHCDRSYWHKQVGAFSDLYRLLLPDLVGHGTSGKARDAWGMHAFGRDIASLVDAEVDGPVILVGHSMGGPIILEAARHLDNVVGLVAVDTLRDVNLHAPPPDERAAQLQALRENYAAVAGSIVESFFVEDTDPELQLAITEGMLDGDADRGVAMIAGLWETDIPALLQQLDVPLVIINSDYQPTDVDALRALHEDVDFIEMRGVGHFPMLEDPENFNSRLGTVLGRFASHD